MATSAFREVKRTINFIKQFIIHTDYWVEMLEFTLFLTFTVFLKIWQIICQSQSESGEQGR